MAITNAEIVRMEQLRLLEEGVATEEEIEKLERLEERIKK